MKNERQQRNGIAEELSFKWLHRIMFITDSKVGTNLHDSLSE